MAKQENSVFKQVMGYLKRLEHKTERRCFFWRNNNNPVYDPVMQMFRKRHPQTPLGLPDIIGCYYGKLVGIEVKGPGGKPSQAQKVIKCKIEDAGGTVIIAWSYEDVEKALKRLEVVPQGDP